MLSVWIVVEVGYKGLAVGYLVLDGLQWKRGSMIAWITANVVEIEGGGTARIGGEVVEREALVVVVATS